MPWADVYTAFATGQVDAVTAAFTFPYKAKHVEYAKYFTNLKECFQPIAPVIGISTWNRLTPEQQNALQQAAEDAGEEVRAGELRARPGIQIRGHERLWRQLHRGSAQALA